VGGSGGSYRGGIMYMMTKNVKFLVGFAILSTFITIGMSVAGY
jgi:type IV conjugative transfer system pilin TraA